MRFYIGFLLLWMSFYSIGYAGDLDKPVDNPVIEKPYRF